ncbi:response regulator transcription factor [Daejeonella lutea]|uniref:DNA-binding response regulator, OmpR family, contains REC and winged-helix (WHTH) domain n=1 Tax=Daejeonella lutea TaxID=572036 RepID=A0A1T5BDF5_9SPHI|nr:response regulator transcription factor [Daejeonella lutea]SKB45107.1 DNA-binding response regulator, OmpR family, contains REC and winged-helix (wHTH) domain [Daejeonella lutea]
MKILVIEDEAAMLDNIVDALKGEQYLVETADNYDSAIQKVSDYQYDCIVLDISLQNTRDGLDILRELKKLNKADGVIIVSAKNSLDDKVAGLDLGADDYLAKPFHLSELLARVKAVIRRRSFSGNDHINAGNLKIDISQQSAYVGEQPFITNRKEFEVLLYLVTNKNRLVNRAALAEHVWGDHIDSADNFDFIYSQIKNIRKKLKDAKALVDIQSIYGVGYKLQAE